MRGELVVDFVNFLEAGLVLQTENQDDRVHPAGQLERGEEGRRLSEHGRSTPSEDLNDAIKSSNTPEPLGVRSPL